MAIQFELLISIRVIYLSLDKVHEALDAYKKANALEPNNDNYKQSIRICEDRLSSAGPGLGAAGVRKKNICFQQESKLFEAIFFQMPNMPSMLGSLLGGVGGAGGAGGTPDMMSFFNNPSLMNMVCSINKKISLFNFVFRQCNSFKIPKFKDCSLKFHF